MTASEYKRGLNKLRRAREAYEELRASHLDSIRELQAMESLAAILFERAESGDTAQWRKELLEASSKEDWPRVARLIHDGHSDTELYDSLFSKLAVLAKTRHDAQSEMTKRQHVITQGQVVELLCAWANAIRLELGPQGYAQLMPKVVARTPGIGLEEALGVKNE